ncbi:hypothetical protein ACFVGY_01820 [Streptomyces sp. NPDC127106]
MQRLVQTGQRQVQGCLCAGQVVLLQRALVLDEFLADGVSR